AVLALGADGAPAQPRLETLEAQLLEQPAIVGDRESPFGVMVVKELGRRAAPGTPRPAIRPGDRFAHVLDSFAAIDVWCIWPSFVRPLACGSVPDIPSLPLFLESRDRDRKSTRLNSSHVKISYAVFCLKKKKTIRNTMKQ